MGVQNNNYYILMGDVISSGKFDQKELSKKLKLLVENCNKSLRSSILSPYTITLGDEFQGIASSLLSAVESIFYFEEECLKNQYAFKLHYALQYGEISTEINREIAYEMMGSGLTNARQLLTKKSRSRKRFKLDLADKNLTTQLMRLFEVADSIIQSWKTEDYRLIYDMIKIDNNSEVAGLHDKNRDQIWKRRNNLMVKEYNLLKEFILNYIEKL